MFAEPTASKSALIKGLLLVNHSAIQCRTFHNIAMSLGVFVYVSAVIGHCFHVCGYNLNDCENSSSLIWRVVT